MFTRIPVDLDFCGDFINQKQIKVGLQNEFLKKKAIVF